MSALIAALPTTLPGADITVGELITRASAKTGEKVEVRRFARFALGEQ